MRQRKDSTLSPRIRLRKNHAKSASMTAAIRGRVAGIGMPSLSENIQRKRRM
jgi:hypothetical protein